jgi:hypothetical protein
MLGRLRTPIDSGIVVSRLARLVHHPEPVATSRTNKFLAGKCLACRCGLDTYASSARSG